MRLFHITRLRLVIAVGVAGLLASVGVAYAASLGLASNRLFAWTQMLTKRTCNQSSGGSLYAEDDTYVQQSSPTSTAGGTATTLSITNGTTSGQNYAFIRFDLSGCSLPTTGGADNATLSVFVTTATTATISVFPVYSSWSSSTLNWNGLGSLTIGSTATTTFTGSAGSHVLTVTADVDSAIKAGNLWGWEFRDLSTGVAKTTKLGSEENSTTADRPSLTLSYEK